MEPELVCIDANGKANGLGVLKEGFMFKINLESARRFGLLFIKIYSNLKEQVFFNEIKYSID